MSKNAREILFDLLGKFDSAMLVTQDEETSALRSRPMHVAKLEENGDFWFVTGDDSHKVLEIRENKDILLTFQKEHSYYVSLAGKAEVVSDRAKLEDVWSPAFKVWFPEGIDDPSIRLIHVRAVDAEYWNNGGLNKLAFAAETTKALFTETTPDLSGPEHFGHVELGGTVARL